MRLPGLASSSRILPLTVALALILAGCSKSGGDEGGPVGGGDGRGGGSAMVGFALHVAETLPLGADAVAVVEGPRGERITVTSQATVQRAAGCAWPVAGTVRLDAEGLDGQRLSGTLDFEAGTGACDDVAALHLTDETWTLDRRLAR
ncbi:MAG: hypothetical protein AAGI71_16160 [Bacteroidota bacterium]